MNSVYATSHAYMLRIAIPYGTLSPKQLRMLAHIARKYDKGYGHFDAPEPASSTCSGAVRRAGVLATLPASRCTASRPAETASRLRRPMLRWRGGWRVADPRPYVANSAPMVLNIPGFLPARASSRSR